MFQPHNIRLALVTILFLSLAFAMKHSFDTVKIITDRQVEEVDAGAKQNFDDLKVPEDQQKMIDQAHASLVEIAKKSPKAAELLAFYNKNAHPAIFVDEQRIQVVSVPSGPTPFMLVANPIPMTQLEDGQAQVAAEFDCRMPAMLLRNPDASSFLRGIMLAHELTHAMDCLIDHEPVTGYPDPIWLMGEMHAHQNIFTVLYQYTGGGWDVLVVASRDRREKTVVSQGKHPEAMVFGYLPEDPPAITALFGEQNDLTMGTLLSQLTVDAGMLNIDVQSQHYGLNQEQVDAHRVEFMHEFYMNSGVDLSKP